MHFLRAPSVGLAVALVLAWTSSAVAGDWPQWGGAAGRNMISSERGLADSFVPGEKDPQGKGIRMATTKNVLWATRLGATACSTPAISGGRVFAGVCDEGQGLLKCFDERTGQLLWQWIAPPRDVPKKVGDRIFRFSQFPRTLGVCSSPAVDEGRVYFVTHRLEVLCLDARGAEEKGKPKPKIVWMCDMWDLGVRPSDACNCSVLVEGNMVYVCTSNGVDRDCTAQTHDEFRKVPAPDAPMLIVLDKRTGRLLAMDDVRTGPRLLHGQWSSPSLGEVDGRKLVFLGGGDGVCYAFEALLTPAQPMVEGDQREPGFSRPPVGRPGAFAMQTSITSIPQKPVKLKTAWWCDCNPPEYKQFGDRDLVTHYCLGDRRRSDTINGHDGTFVGMSEIIATPVFHQDRVYIAIGRDPEHGRGRGALWCIDATRQGDVTESGKIWCYQGLDRTLATVSIADGLLYISDVAGRLHCLDADTGRCLWIHEAQATVWGSTLVADGKVYQPTDKALWVLAAGPEKRVLSEIRLGAPVWATPVAANGVLYVASKNYLWAVKK